MIPLLVQASIAIAVLRLFLTASSDLMPGVVASGGLSSFYGFGYVTGGY